MTIRFFVPATLRTKGNRMKIHRRGNRRWIGPTDEQKAAEHFVRVAASPYAPREPFACPIKLDVIFVVQIPKGYTGSKLARARSGALRPDTPDKGDRGNHLKLLEDALEGVFYVNDAQICEGNVAKVFGDVSGYQVEISELAPLQVL